MRAANFLNSFTKSLWLQQQRRSAQQSTRLFSGMQARMQFATTKEKTFLASDLKIERRQQLKEKPGPEHQYAFGALQTDYMLEVDFDLANGGW